MIEKSVWKISKIVLPQHSDHAGVMWHGAYFNWLEEARIKALSEAGINYFDLTKKGYELPIIDSSVKYILPIYLGDKITIESIFNIGKSPKINISTKFVNKNQRVLTTSVVNLVLVNKFNFKIIRKRPDFISKVFCKLNG